MQSDSRKKVVLVVDDDELLLELATIELASLGHLALTAGSAEDALVILQSIARIDLLFTDESLPGASGRELLDWARAARPGLPVILTSGLPRDVFGPLEEVHSFVRLITKPYRGGELGRVIGEILESA